MENMEVKHKLGCPARREEEYTLTASTGVFRIRRCGDCGQQVEMQIGPPRAVDQQGIAPAQVGGPIFSAAQPQVPAVMKKAPSIFTDTTYDMEHRRRHE